MSGALRHIFLIWMSLLSTSLIGQNVMIDEFGNNPDNSAMLEIDDSLSGFNNFHGLLIPRLTEAQKNAIVNPANGLLIYQTDVDSGFHYNRASAASPDWVRLVDISQIVNLETVLIQGDDANGQLLLNVDTVGVDIANLPSNQLTINESAGSTTALQFSDFSSGSSVNDGFYLSLSSGIAELRNRENGPMAFYTNNLERMRLTNSGLSLDSNLASSSLDVNGSARINRLGINSVFSLPTVDGANTEILTTDGTGNVSWTTNTTADNLGNHTAIRNIFLDTNYLSADGNPEGLVIDSIGNAGIGTKSLLKKFTVYDPTFPLLRITASTAGPNNIVDAAVLEFTENNTADIDTDGYGFKIRYVGSGSSTDKLQFWSKNNGTEELVLLLKRTSRRVGLGIDEPDTWFHVVHTNSASDGVSISNLNDNDRWHLYTADTNGLELYYNNGLVGAFSSTSGAYFALSDKRAKKQIVDHQHVLSDLMELDIVEYNYLNESDDELKSIGVIAQQVEKKFPSLINRSFIPESDRSILSVNYFGLNALAVAAAKEQYGELENLEKRIAKLEKNVEKQRK